MTGGLSVQYAISMCISNEDTEYELRNSPLSTVQVKLILRDFG